MLRKLRLAAVTLSFTDRKRNLILCLSSCALFAPALHAAGPSITTLTPNTGAVGASATIAGSGFGTSQGSNTVKFNGVTATVTSWGSSSIGAVVPVGATTGNVVVTVSGKASNGVLFTVVPAPVITGVSPNSGLPGSNVTISGSSFGSTQGYVTFNGNSAAVVSWSTTSVVATVPGAVQATGNVVMFASGVYSNSVSFTAGPQLQGVSPTGASIGGSVTISGWNLGATQGAGTVTFNGTLATTISSWSANSIVATVPNGATTGNVVVTANGMSSSGVSFTVLPSGTPTSVTYHLDQAAGSVTGTDSLINAPPSSPSTFLQSQDLKGLTFQFDYPVGNFTTQTGIGGIITSSSTVTFSLWMKETASVSGLYPVVDLSTASGMDVCSATPGSSTLTTTLTRYTFSCTVPNVVTLDSSNPLYLHVMVGWSGTIHGDVNAQVYFDGTSNGNYDSQVTVPEFLAPVINSISPTSGYVGTSITISGSYFGATQGTSSVTFNGIPATPTNWSDGTIVVPVPPAATSGSVVVTANTQSSGAASFIVQPFISNLSPTSGPVGASITISGSTFGTAQLWNSRITFSGGLYGTNGAPTSWSDTSIVVPVPPGAITGPVTLWAAGQMSNSVNFTVTPSLTRISPSFSSVGSLVNLRGYNFGSSQGSSTVTFNGISTSPVSWANNSVVVPVPTGATNGPVIVTVGGYSSNQVIFTVSPAISNFFPVSGTVGTAVTINGSNFGTSQGTSMVLFNGVPSTPTSWSNTTLVAPVPTGALTGLLTVVVNGASTNGLVFTVTPVISAISPNSGVSGTAVSILGSNFGATQATSLLQFNSVSTTPSSWSNTKIVAPVPGGATSGSVVVTVNNVPSNGMPFTIGLGTIGGIVTQSGNGTAVIGAAVEVLQANSVMGSTTTASDGSYTIRNLSAGNYDVLVAAVGLGTTLKTSNAVTANATTTVNFALSPPGTLSGGVKQGDGITAISGATVTASQSGDVVATATTDSSGNYSIATLAPGIYSAQGSATGYTAQTQNNLNVTVGNTTTANFALPGQSTITYTYDELGRLIGTQDSQSDAVTYQYDPVGNLLSISRNQSSQVSIMGFIPKSGPLGTTVTISGTAFSSTPSQDSVSFNGTQATVTSATSTQLVATVPSGATTGTISVTSPSGTASSTTSFTVISGGSGAPTITSFSPGSGVAGNAISVTGTNFDITAANDSLKFNLTSAPVTSSTATSISVSVPSPLASGRISLGTKNGNATSMQDFFVPFGTHIAADIGFTARMSLNAMQAVSIGTGGKIGLVLFDATAGQQISVSATGSSFSSCNLLLLDPYGHQVSSVGCTSSSHYLGEQTLAYTGTYTLGIDPSSTTGSLTLSLNSFMDQTGVLTLGTPVTVNTNYPGQRAIYSFWGTLGEVISIAAGNMSYSCDTMTLSIVNPDGTTLASTTGCSGVALNSVTLPTTGTYSMVANPGSGTGGATYTLTQNITESIALNTPQTVSGTLAGQIFDLTFSGALGQIVSLAEINNTYPCQGMRFYVLNPDGSTLAWGLACNSGSLNSLTLPANGTYTVYVNSGYTAGGATFVLTQNIIEPIALSTPLNISGTVAGQSFDLTFSGTAGQVVSVSETNNTYACQALHFSIVKPDGSTLASTLVCGSSGSLNGQTLPTTGMYTVYVNPSFYTGSGTFTLTSP
jgi:YD repeat-containing protein